VPASWSSSVWGFTSNPPPLPPRATHDTLRASLPPPPLPPPALPHPPLSRSAPSPTPPSSLTPLPPQQLQDLPDATFPHHPHSLPPPTPSCLTPSTSHPLSAMLERVEGSWVGVPGGADVQSRRVFWQDSFLAISDLNCDENYYTPELFVTSQSKRVVIFIERTFQKILCAKILASMRLGTPYTRTEAEEATHFDAGTRSTWITWRMALGKAKP